MIRGHRLARLLRALPGKTQQQLSEETGVHRSVIAQIELGDALPSRDHLEAMAESARITLPDAERILHLYETYRRSRRRWGRDASEVLDRMTEEVRSQAGAAYRRLLTLSLPEPLLSPGDRERAEELYSRLAGLSAEARLAVVRVAEEYQTWYLCERVCLASVQAASRDVESAAEWARLAQEIAERVAGPDRKS